MKITRVEATYLKDIKIQPPPSRSEPSRRDAIVIEVETDDGLVGYALNAERSGYAATIGYITGVLADQLGGRNPLLVEQIWNDLTRSVENQTIIRAIANIDTCLWDFRGKALGQPVWTPRRGRARTTTGPTRACGNASASSRRAPRSRGCSGGTARGARSKVSRLRARARCASCSSPRRGSRMPPT